MWIAESICSVSLAATTQFLSKLQKIAVVSTPAPHLCVALVAASSLTWLWEYAWHCFTIRNPQWGGGIQPDTDALQGIHHQGNIGYFAIPVLKQVMMHVQFDDFVVAADPCEPLHALVAELLGLWLSHLTALQQSKLYACAIVQMTNLLWGICDRPSPTFHTAAPEAGFL